MRVVNLFGGPGVGKSTTAALVFGELKRRGHVAELVTEYAKEIIWEERSTLRCQPYLFGKQLWRLERLRDKVDIVVTDAPLLLFVAYGEHLGPAWKEVVYAQADTFENVNVFLERDLTIPYTTDGRYQATVEDAIKFDELVRGMLQSAGIEYYTACVGDEVPVVDQIVGLV